MKTLTDHDAVCNLDTDHLCYCAFKTTMSNSSFLKQVDEMLAKNKDRVPELQVSKDLDVGMKFDSDKPRMDLVSPLAMEEFAKVLTFGAKKYADHNWSKGFAWSRPLGAILRHTYAYLRGETLDPESGLSHMAHVMCSAMFLLEFEKTRPELDDRRKV